MMSSGAVSKKLFVCRTLELQKLQNFLDLASEGQPQICFVAGEAGSGKTTLIDKFLEESTQIYPNVVSATGECSSQTGPTDPYLPFKLIIRTFVDLLDENAGAAQSHLKKFARLSAQTIIEIAPDLIGNFLPGGSLLAKGLEILIEKSDIGGKILADKSSKKFLELKDNSVSQHEICQQYTSYLQAISKAYILILVIEDLHWVDQSSLNLLFHFVRSLKEGKILIIGTYRPEDVRIGVDGARHPLESTLNEIRRYRGDVTIDLNQISEASRRDFVNALVDAEPNKLDAAFRDNFLALTEGNALFATEMLYYLKENRYIRKNENSEWIVDKDLNWDRLPSRVEAVIRERVDRVGEELKRALTIASVEGENFTVQVIGRLQDVNDGLILERISSQLSKRHHLVEEENPVDVGGNDLALFRFSHSLVQQFIYQEIGPSERRLLHKGVAETLERLYGENTHLIGPQLARHYEEAHVLDKAVHYNLISGDNALLISAYREAKLFFEHALKLEPIKDLDLIHKKLGIACYGLGLLEDAKDNLERGIGVARHIGSSLSVAECEAWLGRVYVDLGDFESARRVVDDGLDLTEMSDPELFAHLLNELAYVNMSTEFLDVAENLNRKSLEICKSHSFLTLAAKVLYDLGCCLHVNGNILEAIECLNQAILITQTVRSRSIEAYSLNEIGWIKFEMKEYQIAFDSFNNGLSIGKSLDNKWLICESLNGIGFYYCAKNDVENSEKYLRQALRIGNEIGGMTETLLILVGFAQLKLKKNDIQGACDLLRIALNHPSSDYEIKHFAKQTLTEIENFDERCAESKSDIKMDYEVAVEKILDTID